jgi:diguanylate cyclase (GGDEF)-like protein
VEAERAITRLRRELEESEAREHEQQALFHILPDLVRQMFATAGRREVLPLVLKLLDQTFRPQQAAIFMARGNEKKLALGLGSGLPPTLPPGHELDFGQGSIGYVAANRLAMDDADFKAATALVRRQLEATAIKDFKTDVVAPIEAEGKLLGVVSVGGPSLRQAHAKRLLKMLADITGVALIYVSRLRSTQQAADIDGLTGTMNKRAFQRRLGDEVHKAERQNIPLSMLMLDIDHFKNYNDTNGHLEGDEVLKALGQILRESVREDDVTARYGGEEFIVLYPGVPKSQAMALAESLRQTVESHAFAHGAKQPGGRVTLSGGVAAFPEDSRTSVDLIRSADQALYEAKAAGRNRIVGASPNYLT